jgi:hypothetical protein
VRPIVRVRFASAPNAKNGNPRVQPLEEATRGGFGNIQAFRNFISFCFCHESAQQIGVQASAQQEVGRLEKHGRGQSALLRNNPHVNRNFDHLLIHAFGKLSIRPEPQRDLALGGSEAEQRVHGREERPGFGYGLRLLRFQFVHHPARGP